MATDYIRELAERAFKKISPDEWRQSEEIRRYLGEKPRTELALAQELETLAPLQAEVAWHIGYTPSKWLLENELAEINERRKESKIAWLDGNGNWQGEGAGAIIEREKEENLEWKVTARSDDPYDRAARSGLMGLCFSGGGIRSATFNLGILQGLAELGILKCFDYLASVSGGGYVHQWLTAWGKRKTFSAVAKEMIPLPEPHSPQSHPEPIRWLRRYSNYLTPEKGLFTADSWVTLATWLRNTLLNQVILISGLLFFVLLPHLFTYAEFVPNREWAVVITVAVIVYLFLVAAAMSGRELSLLQFADSAAKPAPGKESFLDQSGVQALLVLPLLAASVLVTLLFPIEAVGFAYAVGLALVPALYLVLTLTVTFAGGTLTSYLHSHHFIASGETAKDFFWGRRWCFAHVRGVIAFVLLVLAALVVASGGAAWHVLVSLMTWLLPGSSVGHLWRLELVIAPPLLLMGPLFSVLLLIGLIGRTFKDARREWLARLGAWVGLYALAWVIFVGGSLFGLVILKWLAGKLYAGIPVFVGWIGTSVMSVLAGQSSKTSGAKDDEAPSRFNLLEIVARVGPYVFIAGLLILLSALADCMIRGHGVMYFLIAMLVAALVCALFAWRVDINEFSMHAYYRDRLARCYLGATNPKRNPNPFTGFDEEDSNIAVSSLSASNGYWGPYPIFCATLNLTFGDELAWQERKGASFVFAPLLSGYDVGWTAAKGPGKGLRFNGYAETATYAYPKPGIHVSTAAAISGAALSPNMGYHTNAATAFLLTVFNVRLGWWLRNPRTIAQNGKHLDFDGVNGKRRRIGFFRDPYPWPSPRFALLSLANELLGRTNDTSAYLYLTDGGHFDNMGLYELVRRRCRYIVICDAEEDGQLSFGGIGMAIRKCRIDFGAEVSLDLRPLQHIDGGRSRAHCVVGTVTYPEDAKTVPPRRPGIVVYIKSSLTGDESADVLNYKREDPSFPHDSTLNQWFTESQFESYRRLGHHVAYSTFEPGSPDSNDCKDCVKRDAYFGTLRGIWYARTPEMDLHSAEHSKRYEALLRRIRKDEKLPGLFEMLFTPGDGKWEPGRTPAEVEHARAVSSDLIEFIFLVFLELNLVFPEKRTHPFSRGWYAVFRNWSRIDAVQNGWKIFSHGYSKSFRLFAQKELGFPEA